MNVTGDALMLQGFPDEVYSKGFHFMLLLSTCILFSDIGAKWGENLKDALSYLLRQYRVLQGQTCTGCMYGQSPRDKRVATLSSQIVGHMM